MACFYLWNTGLIMSFQISDVIACTALNPHSTLLNFEPVPQVLKQVVNMCCFLMNMVYNLMLYNTLH